MDYEKKYNEALERAKKWIKEHPSFLNGGQPLIMGEALLRNIFPELRESEDERIINQLITLVNSTGEVLLIPTNKEELVSWLEKQKELPFVKDVMLGYPGIYFYDGERMHFRGNPAMEEKQKETLHIVESCKENPDSFTSLPENAETGTQEQEFIRTLKSLIADFIRDKQPEDVGYYQQIYDWLDGRHIEQKPVTPDEISAAYQLGLKAGREEQQPSEKKAFEKWVEDYWSHNKVNNPYSYNKGDEIQFDHKGFVSFCETYCYPQNLVLHDTFGYEEGRQTGQNEGVKLVLNNPEKYGLQKEQKPNIELIQKSWYMEGYNDRKFGKEPKWVIKTGDSGPKYEENPKYGQMLEEEQKPAEWSEKDEEIFNNIIEKAKSGHWIEVNEITWLINRFKFLRPSDEEIKKAYTKGFNDAAFGGKAWKPSEEQMEALSWAINYLADVEQECASTLALLKFNLKELM